MFHKFVKMALLYSYITVSGIQAAYDIPLNMSCSISRINIEDAARYSLNSGYRDSIDSTVNSTAISQTVSRRSTHSQHYEENSNELLNYHFVSENGKWFNATEFLSTFRNRNLSIVGDSLGLQLFNSIEAELDRIVTNDLNRTYNSNNTHEHYDYNSKWDPNVVEFPRYNAAMRWYQPYNVSIYYCRDNTIALNTYKKKSKSCTNKAIRVSSGGALVVAMGAWYKPVDRGNYSENLIEAISKYTYHVYILRKYIQAHLSLPTQVIWRLNSHVGPIDEYNAAHPTGHSYQHSDGSFWDMYPKEAHWPLHFNQVLRGIAHLYGDYLLDHYTVSKKFIQLSNELDEQRMRTLNISISETTLSELKKYHLRVHSDVVHYCAGGIFRAGLILLHDLLTHYIKCHKYESHSTH